MFALYIAIALVVLYVVFSLFMANFLARILYEVPKKFAPTKETVKANCIRDYKTDYEDYENWETVHFTLKNGDYEIPAEFHPVENMRGCAVVAHGFGQNRYVMVGQAKILRDLGFSTILFDQRRFGVSEASFGSIGWKESDDVAKLVGWAKEKCGADIRIVLIGVSMGAMSSMNALRWRDDIDAVIEDCGPATATPIAANFQKTLFPIPNPFILPIVRAKAKKYGLTIDENRPIDAVRNSNTPVCVIHGEADRLVPVQVGKEIFEASSNFHSRIVTFPGRDHAMSLCDIEKYRQVLTDFLAETVPVLKK